MTIYLLIWAFFDQHYVNRVEGESSLIWWTSNKNDTTLHIVFSSVTDSIGLAQY